ncbi:MAG: hypothetical protein KGI50_05075 [Patescibacteria group bacterium]|nr:hypothetical protein [Patescibacteria group bacterium]MDE2438691.1 hypothetical protein [Patescibacteria group bacterium]
MALAHYKVRDALAKQALKEIDYSYRYKKARMSSWNKNEDMMNPDRMSPAVVSPYGSTTFQQAGDTRAQVPLYKMHGFVHTILSKIDSPLTFKYVKGESADLKKSKLMNAIKEKDAKTGRWNFKDLMGKRDAAIYGRAIYLYLTRNDKGLYRSLLNLIDPKDFLIDPDVGGLCTEEEDGSGVEKAAYLGWWNTKLSRAQLTKGIKDGIYYKKVVEDLLDGGTNTTTKTKQDIDKDNRKINGAPRERFKNENQFIFYTWITTDENDDRYYLVLTPSGDCIRCEPWKDIRKSERYPIWTWAAFPDPREFWTPSYCDFARGIFMAQEKSINQSLDNSEQINRPQTAVNVDYVRNLAQVRYRKDGYIEIEGNIDVNKVLQTRQTPPIEGPFKVYDKLESIVETESGVTADVKGTSDEDTLGIYEGNLMQAGDRFGLLNKSYAEGYYRFAVLHKEGVMQDLKKKMAVQILGPMGLEIEMVSARDLKPFQNDYDILVESSIAEAQSNLADSKNKLTFLGAYKGDQNINQKVLFETQATIAGVDDDTVKRLLDTSDYNAIEIVAQADEAFQMLIGGHKPPLYKDANTAFLQRLHDLSDKYDHELTSEQHAAVFSYIDEITPVVEKNAARSVVAESAKLGLISGGGKKVDGTGLENTDLAATGEVPLGNPGAEVAETGALSK